MHVDSMIHAWWRETDDKRAQGRLLSLVPWTSEKSSAPRPCGSSIDDHDKGTVLSEISLGVRGRNIGLWLGVATQVYF